VSYGQEAIEIEPEPSKGWAGWFHRQQLSRGFWTFFTAAFFFDFGFSIYFFFINLYLSQQGFRENSLGFVTGALTLGSVTATIPVGFLARRYGLRSVLLACFVLAPLLGVARLFVSSIQLQIVFAFLAGMAMCCWAVCYAPVLARITSQDNRATGFSLVYSSGIGSSALGGVLCGYLPAFLRAAGFKMNPLSSTRMILACSCVFAFIGIAAIMRLRVAVPSDEVRQKTAWRLHPYLWRFLPAMALWTTVTASFVPFAAVYFNRSLGVSVTNVSFIFSASQLVQLCSGLMAPLLFRVAGLLPGIVYTQIATAAGMLLLSATTHSQTAVLLFLCFTATQWMNGPGIYSLLMTSVPENEQTSASALTSFCNSVLQAAGAAGAGLVITHFGYHKLLATLALLALIAAMIFRFALKPRIPSSSISLISHY
jgi:MFS family permease